MGVWMDIWWKNGWTYGGWTHSVHAETTFYHFLKYHNEHLGFGADGSRVRASINLHAPEINTKLQTPKRRSGAVTLDGVFNIGYKRNVTMFSLRLEVCKCGN